MDFKIESITQTSRMDASGNIREVYDIIFSVGNMKGFTVSVPVEGYTAQTGREAVQKRAQEIINTIGM